MCRNIKTLHNFEPPATEDEIRASALQFVRKLSGFGPGRRSASIPPPRDKSAQTVSPWAGPPMGDADESAMNPCHHQLTEARSGDQRCCHIWFPMAGNARFAGGSRDNT